MELIRSERCWEEVGIQTYVETEVKTSNGEKFIIKIHEDEKLGIRYDIENDKGQIIDRIK